jgi:two-component system, NarL family, sensor kinase
MDTSEKAFYSAFVIALTIVGGILVFFIFSIIRQHKRYRTLAKAKIKAEIGTLENERKRIASDLHDEVGPLLSAVKLQINHIESDDENQNTLVKKSSGYIDEVIKKMREISNDLLPSILVRRGLAVAVEDFLEKIRPGTSMKMEAEIELPQRLPLEMEINLYRVIQEITHNALKHSKARRFRIELRKTKNMLQLATADDGVGLPLDIINRSEAGHGLLNLQSRADVLGGQLHWQSSPGNGTKYLLEIPLSQLQDI